jgi:phosphoglycolate phosphatase
MAGKDKIFVFDLDGTLADTAPALLDAGNQVLRSIGRNPIELEQYKGFIGGGTKKQVEKLLNYTGGIPDRGLDFYLKVFQDRYYEDPVKECYLYEGVVELIEVLKSHGVKLAICTQKFENSAKKVLLQLNVYKFFDGFAYGDSTGALKPDPKVFYHSVKGLGDGTYFYVGDTEVDLLLAKAVGANFFFHKKGYSPQTAERDGIEFCFDSYIELIDYYEKNLV